MSLRLDLSPALSAAAPSSDEQPPEGFEFVTLDAVVVTQDGEGVYVPE